MIRFLLALLIGLLTSGCLAPEAAPAAPAAGAESVRIATWNVRNLFDPVDDSYSDEVPTPDEYARKLGRLAAVIERLEPDFLALQEVENLDTLRALNDRLSRPFPHLGLLEGNDTARGIDVAFLSRLPVAEVATHKDFPLRDHPDLSPKYKFSRDCLQVVVATEPPLVLLVNHFKSGMGDAKKSAAKRRVQAEAVVEIARLVDEPASRAVVILGDLNDQPDSWALAPLFEAFTDPLAAVPRAERATHRYRKKGSALDHILLDREAAAALRSARVWSRLGKETSDHDPVSVELYLRVPDQTVQEKVWDRPGP